MNALRLGVWGPLTYLIVHKNRNKRGFWRL